jgi:hypothetical protein
MHYENRTYATALTIDLSKVDFSQVMETASSTVRKSVNETEFLIKWYTDHEPTFITDGSVTVTWSGTHEECLTLMATAEWTEPINL